MFRFQFTRLSAVLSSLSRGLAIGGLAATLLLAGDLATGVLATGVMAVRASEPPAGQDGAAELDRAAELNQVESNSSKSTPPNPISPAEQKIREALEGNSSPGQTGDGTLDDILGIIKKEGSILKGSLLDPTHSDAAIGATIRSDSKRAVAAEQMLKAARLLENVGRPNQERAALVNRMRAEAVKLLSE